MKKEQISRVVDEWIAEEELPVNARLMVDRASLYDGMDDDELEAYFEFRSWFMGRDYQLLELIPKPANERDFWVFEDDNSISFPFSSADFQNEHPRFIDYQWRDRQVYEKVKDLADTYSAISNSEGKANTLQRYRNLVEVRFRDRAVFLLDTFKKHGQLLDRVKCMKEISRLNDKVRKCKEVWKQFAYAS